MTAEGRRCSDHRVERDAFVHYGNQGNYGKSRVMIIACREGLMRGKVENRMIDAFVKRIVSYVPIAARRVS